MEKFAAMEFQPTLPLRGATGAPHWQRAQRLGFNPRSPCGERPARRRHQPVNGAVSTHAPLAGSDAGRAVHHRGRHVSTHAPLAGSDLPCAANGQAGDRFQPTLPLRGATAEALAPATRWPSFNPRSPCGERHFCALTQMQQIKFQPTLPLRGATTPTPTTRRRCSSFNPRSPCGERRREKVLTSRGIQFQPTLPLRGATVFGRLGSVRGRVSTHAPLAGSDVHGGRAHGGLGFQPTLPLRGATMWTSGAIMGNRFQPTLPLRGATSASPETAKGSKAFQPTLPLRGATRGPGTGDALAQFQPTLPLRGATFSRLTRI